MKICKKQFDALMMMQWLKVHQYEPVVFLSVFVEKKVEVMEKYTIPNRTTRNTISADLTWQAFWPPEIKLPPWLYYSIINCFKMWWICSDGLSSGIQDRGINLERAAAAQVGDLEVISNKENKWYSHDSLALKK